MFEEAERFLELELFLEAEHFLDADLFCEADRRLFFEADRRTGGERVCRDTERLAELCERLQLRLCALALSVRSSDDEDEAGILTQELSVKTNSPK